MLLKQICLIQAFRSFIQVVSPDLMYVLGYVHVGQASRTAELALDISSCLRDNLFFMYPLTISTKEFIRLSGFRTGISTQNDLEVTNLRVGRFVDANEEESECQLCERGGRHFLPFFFHIAESMLCFAFFLAHTHKRALP